MRGNPEKKHRQKQVNGTYLTEAPTHEGTDTRGAGGQTQATREAGCATGLRLREEETHSGPALSTGHMA